MNRSSENPAMNENSPKSDYEQAVWTLFIVCFVSGLLMQLQGLSTLDTLSGGSYLWWAAFGLVVTPILIYYIITPISFILLSIHLIRYEENRNTLTLVSGIFSLGAGILWFLFFLTYRFLGPLELSGVVLSIFYWSGAIILFGVTYFFIGIVHLKKEPTALARLTGLSFVVVGIICVIVGYIGGFTLLPWFSVYDFPWVTAIAAIPCCLALLLNYHFPSL